MFWLIYDLLDNKLNYALVFGAEAIFFQDTVQALAVDSYDSGKVNVLGIHKDWFAPDSRRARRAIVVDESGMVKEVVFEEPVAVDIVHILHLPLKNERQIHEELSDYFHSLGIPQINAYNTSKRADNKAWSHELWEKYDQEIISPEYILIRSNASTKEIYEQLEAFAEKGISEFVVQPNKGTEGYKAEKFSASDSLSIVVDYIKYQILPEDDAIVREKRGNVKYVSNLNITFRLNVAWDGSEFIAESGYAQVAKDENTFPASRGRGGKIIDINEALANLYYLKDGEWSRFILTEADILSIKYAAVRAAYGLNAGLRPEDYLKFMGVDIVLEAGEDLTPVVLEANPRPAGLAQSMEIVGISSKKPQPGVSKGIFEFMEKGFMDGKYRD